MATIDLTEASFDETILGNDIVFVDFWASWCGPCRQFAPVYEQVSEKHPEIVFAKVDTDANRRLAAEANITSIPTLMAFREQVLVFSQPGALPANAFAELVDAVKGLDMPAVHAQIEASTTDAGTESA
ncbi:thioredoxin [Luethyella okanaganae]|uniref:Thioredoxin n=1 Tax=Luethyella okanaganae TaxID=69372 RepID=A0ABW1VH56_9MICO